MCYNYREEAEKMKVDSIIQIELYENFGSAYPLDKKSRAFNGIIYNVEDSGRILINGKCWICGPGDVIFFRKNENYRVELLNNHIKCYVIDYLGENDCEYMIVRECEDIQPLFERAAQLWRRHREDEYFMLDCTALTYRILAEIRRRNDLVVKSLRKTERLRPALECIHRDYCDPGLKISELAELVGVSERSFSKSFGEIYGCSPKRYLTKLRIKRAKELLSANSSREYPISEVAKQVGIADLYHFSNFFRRECGMPPSEYRKKMRDGFSD